MVLSSHIWVHSPSSGIWVLGGEYQRRQRPSSDSYHWFSKSLLLAKYVQGKHSEWHCIRLLNTSWDHIHKCGILVDWSPISTLKIPAWRVFIMLSHDLTFLNHCSPGNNLTTGHDQFFFPLILYLRIRHFKRVHTTQVWESSDSYFTTVTCVSLKLTYREFPPWTTTREYKRTEANSKSETHIFPL